MANDLFPKYVNQLEQDSHDNSANVTVKRVGLQGWNSSTLQWERVATINGIVQSNSVLSASPLNGQAVIAITGTAVQLGANILNNGVIITAKSTNVAPIVVGISSVTNVVSGTGAGYILEAGASMSWAVTNTNTLYINGTAGDIVSFAGS